MHRMRKRNRILLPSFLMLATVGCATVAPEPVPVELPADVVQLAQPGPLSPASEATAAILAAELSGRRGRTDMAARYTLDAARITGDVQLAQRATQLAFSAQDEDLAREASELWLRLAPADHEALSLALRARVADGVATVDELEKWLDGATDTRMAEQQLAGMLGLASPDADQALALLGQLEERRPTASLAYAFGVLALRYEELDATLLALERAEDRGWDRRACDELRLRVYMARQDDDAAQAVAKRLRAAMREDRQGALTLGQYLLDSQAWEMARDQFAFVARMWPKDPAARLALGLLEAQQGNLDAARENFEALWQTGVRKNEAAWQLGRLAGLQKDWPRAELWFGRVTDGTRLLDSRLATAQVMVEQGRILEARSLLSEQRAEHPGQVARIWRAEAEILQKNQQFDDAIRVLGQGIDETQAIELYYLRALIREQRGDLDGARADLNAIIGVDPDNAQALNALGYLLADHGLELDKARKLIERALALRPDDPAIRDSLGWVLYRLGQPEQARVELEAAYAVFPDAEIAAHLGEVLWVLGEQDAAREVVREALTQAPTSIKLLKVWQRFTRP